MPAVLAAVVAAAGGRGTPADLLDGRVWHLGGVPLLGRTRDVLFARNAVRASRPAAVEVVGKRPRAVLLVPTEEAAAGWLGTVPNPVAALESVASITADGLAFDRAAVEGRLADALPAGPTRPRKPARKRGGRAAAIERLAAEMREHLLAARDHAVDTRDRTGTPDLLPRPTRKQLAERLDLSETVVSRCFSDPAARELALLWKMAQDIDEIVRWRPRR